MKGFTVFAIFLFTMIQNGLAQFAGATFEERKRAYINDQGRKWAYAFPAAMKQGLFAWLERPDQGNNRSLISEEIDYLTRDDDCRARGGNFWWPWKNCWWTGDHPTPLIVSRVLYQYGNVISDSDKQKIQDQLRIIAFTPGVWCANYNYHVCYIIPAYLYVHYVENIGMIEFPAPDPQYHCPPSFSYNGNNYVGGKSYPARQIYRDYLYYLLDEWQKKGTREDISTSYYEIPVMAMALLHDFAPDPELRKRAKMHLDWLIFNYAVGFSAKTPSGGSGRTYTDQHLKGMFWFPWTQFYRFDQQTIDMITEGRVFTDHYVSTYRHPQLLTQIVESINGVNQTEGDDYYRIIRGNIPEAGLTWWDEQVGILPDGYRYAYVTPNYNLGSPGLGSGWELNINAESV
ncbi:MAG: hypothetical protein ONA90_10115, partial [candidate division KSB1 bacterium]|nr:hypothetical protein [candidate division KSB1 bacterium]